MQSQSAFSPLYSRDCVPGLPWWIPARRPTRGVSVLTDTSPAAIEACSGNHIFGSSQRRRLREPGDRVPAHRRHRPGDQGLRRGDPVEPPCRRCFQQPWECVSQRSTSSSAPCATTTRRFGWIRITPTPSTIAGIIFLELGELDRAIADFDRAIDEESTYANAFRNRGLARTRQRLFDLAIEDFDKAFRLNPAIGHGAGVRACAVRSRSDAPARRRPEGPRRHRGSDASVS